MKKTVCSGMVLLLCIPTSGCAGKRLSQMFSFTSPSDYKTLQQLADEERQGNSASQTQLAGVESPRDSSTVDQEGEPSRFSRLLSFNGRRKTIDTDPFLEQPEAESKAGREQSEMARLAELDQERKESIKAATTRQTTTPAPSTAALDRSLWETADDAERLFADLKQSEADPAPTFDSSTNVKTATQSKTVKEKTADSNPADELEAFLARTEAQGKPGSRQADESDNSGMQLTSGSSGVNSTESFADMFRTLQAGFETPEVHSETGKAVDRRKPASTSRSTSAFDLLLADSEEARDFTGSQAIVDTKSFAALKHVAEETPDSILGAIDFLSDAEPNRVVARRQQSDSHRLTADMEVAERLSRKSTFAVETAPAETADHFGNANSGLAHSLSDEADFAWKPAIQTAEAGSRMPADQPWWQDTHSRSGQRSVSGASFVGMAGLEESPPFNHVSFESEFTDLASGTGAVSVAAVDATPVISPFSRLKVNTFQNWFLLIGAIIVAMLLFGPKRTTVARSARPGSSSGS